MEFSMLPIVVRLMATLMGSIANTVIPPSDEAVLVFAGDAMQHQGQLDAARRGNTFDYSQCFASVKPFISDADYAVVNLETTLGESNFTGYPCFCSPDAYAQSLIDAGFDMFLTANNHTLDRLDRGHARTIHVLDSLGIDHIGTWRNADERQRRLPFIRDINGFKIAFLNYTYGTNGIKLKGDGVVDYIDRQLISDDIENAKKAGAEIIAASIHWGVEYKLLPHPSQRSLASYLRDMGVDLIIGGHPHVIQPMELTEADSTGRRILTVYSLGNFISNMRTTDTRGGAMVKVVLRRSPDGLPAIHSAEYALVFTVPAGSGQSNYRLYPIDSDSIPSAWRSRASAFASSARRIFSAHNRNVEEVSAR